MDPDADDLDGYERANVYEDGTVVRISIRRTSDSAYPSGWRYTFHYGSLTPDEQTLEDGTIRRYDNAHEDTKGHEIHVAPDPEPEIINFPGIEELYLRFWDEIPKPKFGPTNG
ncbi:toxin-antitoxin system TumE family protein [Natronorubrum sp. FCH18a]|uniref:toxin-antitoxin system TumE family protein n=1 Tax=Natronorubrum sp. FCH18a TaxID=3447018 RepID=UPI003F50E2A4